MISLSSLVLVTIIRNNSYRLRHLDTGALTQPATDTMFQHFRLFHPANPDGDIRQRTGAVANAATLALPGQAQTVIDNRMPHADLIEYRLHFSRYLADRIGRTDITTLHAQNASLIARRNIGRVHHRRTIFKTEIMDTAVWTDLAALPAMNATRNKIIFRQGAGRSQITLRRALLGIPDRRSDSQRRSTGDQTLQERASIHHSE